MKNIKVKIAVDFTMKVPDGASAKKIEALILKKIKKEKFIEFKDRAFKKDGPYSPTKTDNIFFSGYEKGVKGMRVTSFYDKYREYCTLVGRKNMAKKREFTSIIPFESRVMGTKRIFYARKKRIVG